MSLLRASAVALCIAATPSAAHARCALAPGWHSTRADHARFVVFGEVHGSVQSPALFGETVCALANRHDRLLVALELGDNDGLQRAWALPHRQFARQLAGLVTDWGSRNDGVPSQALFAMLVKLHALKSAGLLIDVVAFNGEPDGDQQQRFVDLREPALHEAIQADNIRRVAEAESYRQVLVLVGNVHARKRTIDYHGTRYEPMAARLAPASQIISLNMAYRAGATWSCELKGAFRPGVQITNDQIECAAHPVSANVDWQTAPRFVRLAADAGQVNPDGAYDGAYFVGPVTTSPPKIAQP